MKDLTKGNLYKTFLVFAFPMVLSAMLSQAYNLIDTVIAGRYLGEVGLGAIGATAPLITFLSSIFWGFNQGFSIYIARLFGAKEYFRIKRGIITHFLLFFVSCVVLCGAAVLFYNPIFDLLSVADEIRDEAFIYFAVYMAGEFFVMINQHGLYLMNAFGSGTFPFWMSVISAILNVTGNILSVTVLGWGVFGIALSTVFAAFVTSVLYILKVLSCFREMGVCKQKTGLSLSEIRASVPYSVPGCLQQMAMYFSSLILSPAVNGLGASASAAYTVVLKIYNINACVYQNSAKTLSNFSAQCVGAGKTEQISRGIRVSLLQGLLFVSPILAVCLIFPDAICSLFMDASAQNADAVLSLISRFITVYLPFVLINLINNLFHSLLRGVKQSGYLMTSTVIGSLSRIIASYALVSALAMDGFYLGWVISWACEALFCLYLFVSGKWRPKEWGECRSAIGT